ncbi:MAG: hypothetical protein KKD18_02860 [Nanoarchaeota archaeon]|nr:hypothetical protein [Nanoarchaeota archaeon]MBU0977330.1 hypothetical protein [Nanoarchaeota archaeon]
MAKEAKKEPTKKSPKDPNAYGVWAMVVGMFSVITSPAPVFGLILGVVGFFLASAQEKREKNSWSKAGKILSIFGIIFSIIIFILALWISKNPELLAQYGGATYGLP